MSTKEMLVDGKGKKIYSTEDPGIVLVHYTDVASAYGGIKTASIKDKGKCNNAISAFAFEAMTAAGIPNHFISLENEREQLCRKVAMIPLQIIVRNRLAGTTAAMLGLKNGAEIGNTVFELRYNSRSLGNPMINEHHAVALGIVTYEEVGEILSLAKRTNEVLKDTFHKAGIELVDFKMECGKDADGHIIIADEISPDNCRLWDEKSGEILDKDRFRHDMSDVCISYRTIMERLSKSVKL